MPGVFTFESSSPHGSGERGPRRRVGLLACALAVGSVAAFGPLAGQAWAGSTHGVSPTAAQDQYTPPPIPKPKPKQMKPPGAQASAPTTHHMTHSGALPFTGLSLLKVVLVGVALLVLGVLLRRGSPRRGP